MIPNGSETEGGINLNFPFNLAKTLFSKEKGSN